MTIEAGLTENVYLLNSEGYIRSSNYPSPYNPNANARYTIILPEPGNITLRFQHFDVESHPTCSYDYLTIEINHCGHISVSGELYLQNKY